MSAKRNQQRRSNGEQWHITIATIWLNISWCSAVWADIATRQNVFQLLYREIVHALVHVFFVHKASVYAFAAVSCLDAGLREPRLASVLFARLFLVRSFLRQVWDETSRDRLPASHESVRDFVRLRRRSVGAYGSSVTSTVSFDRR
jgi:hypothetical protein